MLKMLKNLVSYLGIFITIGLFLYFSYMLLFYEKKAKWEGMLVKETPSQVDMNSSQSFEYKKSILMPVAYYNLKGVVLNTKRYFTDDMSDLSPIDIVVGWNKMSDSGVVNKFKYAQENRLYTVTPKNKIDVPLDYKEVMLYSSNNHCIPANEEVMNQLGELKQFDYVSLRGLLVSVKKQGFDLWKTSVVRNDDSYVGSEIFYVDRVEVLDIKK